jgi:hypothetical protein
VAFKERFSVTPCATPQQATTETIKRRDDRERIAGLSRIIRQWFERLEVLTNVNIGLIRLQDYWLYALLDGYGINYLSSADLAY